MIIILNRESFAMRTLLFIFVFLGLSSCSWLHVHKMDIEQGNIITQQDVNQVHLGMTETQVKNILGTPVLLNTFRNNRVDYVYTLKPGYGDMTEKHITLIFESGHLKEITGNLYSQYMQ